MFENLHIAAAPPPAPEPEPDFARGLYLSEKMGHEFSAVGKSSMLAQTILSQGFAILFIIPIALFYGIRNLLGGSILLAGLAAGVVGATLIILGIIAMARVRGGNNPGTSLKAATDSRYRIRAIIPKRRQNQGFRQWAEVTLHVKPKEPEEIQQLDVDDLDAERGGFEPIIVRPWFGIERRKRFWYATLVCGLIGVSILLFLMQFVFGGWSAMMKSGGFMTYAAFGFAMVSGAIGAELIYPVYIRIVPGRLDIFRYGFLGSGKPEVQTYDLRTIGLCVDFGTFTVALERPRPPGEPLPEFVASKRWPYAKIHPDGHTPDYFTLALSPGRMEHCQKLIQAARTTEPTPDLPDDELLG
ncbi:MAG: hypothetical protein KC996_03820 [Phycisphaerales bacterium]|nr:hypothetical protein [Phycisphaerales bacterium]